MDSMLTLIVVGLLGWLVGSVALSMLVGRHLAHQYAALVARAADSGSRPGDQRSSTGLARRVESAQASAKSTHFCYRCVTIEAWQW